jgi:membrane protein DedA with SNARE-associated domain
VLDQLAELIAKHGYWVLGTAIAIESMGIPLPGETALVLAGIYAATTHELNIVLVIAAAAAGAILGDNIGFMLGRRLGYPLLRRHGGWLRIDERRLKVGQYVFARHGGKVVFFGRFVALLRALAALLAGLNCMAWRQFLFFNATGGIVWAIVFGGGAYLFGERFERLRGPAATIAIVAAVVGCAAGFWFVRHHEAQLHAQAERVMPGPLQPEEWR